MAKLSPERHVENSLRRAERLVTLRSKSGREAAKKLVQLLEDADRELAKRLLGFADRPEAFSAVQAAMYRAQVQHVLEYTKNRLNGLTARQVSVAMRRGVQDTAILLEHMEAAFSDIVRPLAIREAQAIGGITDKLGPTLLRQHATSFDRYGDAMIAEFEQYMRVGMISGQSTRDMVGALTGHGGPRGEVSLAAKVVDGRVIRIRTANIPEGLFKSKKYWAERIVRTEVANAYQAAKDEGMRMERSESMPDLQKKIMAMLDNRTAADSLAVHGQVRDLDEMFIDGAGRMYLRPPARPNDRETIIPWRPHWKENKITRQRTAEEIERALANSLPKQRSKRNRERRAILRKEAAARRKAEEIRMKQAV